MGVTRKDLPTGEVTFLFTDIEGSTRLAHELGEAYAETLAEHRRRLRASFVAHRGVEVDTQGDSFFVAFAAAPDAVAAAASARDALADGPVQVRIGLHTGAPRLTDDGYVGVDVHKGARIASAGHGGQILMSRETRERLTDAPPLLNLGEHRVKDFAEPVWIHQLGTELHPPLRTIANTNLPRPASRFVGRDQERIDVIRLLRDGARLITLTGPGGSGKTRLSIETAAELVPDFRNGVFWVALAPIRDHQLITQAIADQLGARDDLATHISDRELLLVLDNFEHLTDGAPAVSELLRACPNLRALVTSRALLRIDGEVEYAVPPLAASEAVELFCTRSRLPAEDAISELCERLDNLPLAVELAAARATVLTARQIRDRLGKRLDSLVGGRDADPRQRTLRATIEWSYDLLSRPERDLFSRLTVFGGGCTLEAAEQVVHADVDTLQALIEQSLVRHAGDRYWMLETIREYGAEILQAKGQEDELRGGHAAYFLELAEEAQRHLASDQRTWLARLRDERHNLRAAIEWAYSSDQPELGLRIAGGLVRYWWVHGRAEGLALIARGLQASGVRPEVRARAIDAAGGIAWFLGDAEKALALFEDGLRLYTDMGDRPGMALMLNRLGPPLWAIGRSEEGDRAVRSAADINRELDQRAELAMSLHLLGTRAMDHERWDEAEAMVNESIQLCEDLGDTFLLIGNVANLADANVRRGRPVESVTQARRALSAARSIGDDLSCLLSLAVLAAAWNRLGKGRHAGRVWGAALRLDLELGDNYWRPARAGDEALLGERTSDFERGVEEGMRLNLDEAISLAVGGPPIDGPQSSRS